MKQLQMKVGVLWFSHEIKGLPQYIVIGFTRMLQQFSDNLAFPS